MTLSKVLGWRTFWVISFGAAASGCTLLGAGVGAGIDAAVPGPYEVRAPRDRKQLAPGDQVVVGTRAGRRIQGEYRGRHGPTPADLETYLVVDTGKGVQLVPHAEVRNVAVEVTGKGWLYGGLAGAGVDTLVVIGFIMMMKNMKYDYDLYGDSGCFC